MELKTNYSTGQNKLYHGTATGQEWDWDGTEPERG